MCILHHHDDIVTTKLYCNNQIMFLTPACREAGAQTPGHALLLEALRALQLEQLEAVMALLQWKA